MTEVVCAGPSCGNAIDPVGRRGAPRLYCSPKCKRSAANKRTYDRCDKALRAALRRHRYWENREAHLERDRQYYNRLRFLAEAGKHLLKLTGETL